MRLALVVAAMVLALAPVAARAEETSDEQERREKVHGAIAFWTDTLVLRGTASMVPAGSASRMGGQIGTGGAPVVDLGTFSLRGDYSASAGYGKTGLEGHLDAWLGIGVRGYFGSSAEATPDPTKRIPIPAVSITNHGPFARVLFGGEYTGNDDLVLSFGGVGGTAGYEIASTRRLAEVGASAVFVPSGRYRVAIPVRSLDATHAFGLSGSLLGPPVVLRAKAWMLRPREGNRSDPVNVLFGQACGLPLVEVGLLGLRGDAIEVCADAELAWGLAFDAAGATTMARATVVGVSIGIAQFGGLVTR